MEWKHVLQFIEMDYAHGYLFWDRSGVVARKLCDQFPQLVLKNSTPEQKDLVSSEGGLDMFYGVRVAGIQRFGDITPLFSGLAVALHQVLVEDLVLKTITGFRLRHVVARPLSSADEATRALFGFIPTFQKELKTAAPAAEPLAFQVEILSSRSVRATIRISTARLPVNSGEKRTADSDPVPHLIAALLTEGIEPMAADELEVARLLNDNELVLLNQIVPSLEKHVSTA